MGGGGGVGGGVAPGSEGLEGPGAVLGRGERASRPALLGVLLVEGEAQGLGRPVPGPQGGRGGGRGRGGGGGEDHGVSVEANVLNGEQRGRRFEEDCAMYRRNNVLP